MTKYDAWILQGPEEPHQIGIEPGYLCGRVDEPDEDAPRGYRPRPCNGEMIDQHGVIVCCECGSLSE